MTAATHERLERVEHRDNRLLIGGHGIDRLVAMAGQTPCYIYDRGAITRRVAELRAALPPAISLHYAIKANPLAPVVDLMAGLVDGLDVASHRELTLALASGMAPARISFAGPAKADLELRAAVAAGAVVNVESPGELERLAAISTATGWRAQVALRVNPDFELKTSGMKMAGGARPFGIDAERVPQVMARLRELPVDLRGLHIFAGSQNLDAEAIAEAHSRTFELAAALARTWGASLAHVNIGGGLGIPYFPGQRPVDLALVAANLERLIADLPAELAHSELIMELGRYLVGEAGYYICQVVDRKVSRGRQYLLTNGGMHHHLANSGNFGQVLRKNYPVVLAHCLTGDRNEEVDVVGPLCTPLDIVGAGLLLPPVAIGDYLVVLQSGAYGASASPQEFLGHPQAVELLV